MLFRLSLIHIFFLVVVIRVFIQLDLWFWSEGFQNVWTIVAVSYTHLDIGQQIPEAQRATYTQQIEPAIKAMDDSKAQFNNMLSSAGSDDTLVPEQGRTPFLTQIRTARDSMKNILEGVYQSIGEATSSSAE